MVISEKNIHDLIDLTNDFEQNKNKIIEELKSFSYVEVAEFLDNNSLNEEIRYQIFSALDLSVASNVFVELSVDVQKQIYTLSDKITFAKIFSCCLSESRADFYKELEYKEQIQLLPFLPKDIRNDVLALSFYKDDTAGGIMSTDFATLFQDMTVFEALSKLRHDSPSKKMSYRAYVVDKDMKMIGFVDLVNLILADMKAKIQEFTQYNFISSNVNQDKETVCALIEKYSLVAIPILNDENQLIGIVKYDDAIAVIKEEQNEDFEKFMGISGEHDDDDYIKISSWENYRKRISWVVILFFLGIFTCIALTQYEDFMQKNSFLFLFYPMISAVGGNIGSQTAAIIVRALSLNEINIKDSFHVLWKEIKTAFVMSLTFFLLAFCEVIIVGYWESYDGGLWIISFAIALALALQIIFAVILGVILPIIVKSLGQDPAVVASPAITTLVDISGTIIYFCITQRILM